MRSKIRWLYFLYLPLCILSASFSMMSSSYELFLPIIYINSPEQSLIYNSENLSGHSIFAECNPGGDSNCVCSQDDAQIHSYSDYGAVISNPSLRNTYVNSIGYKKFTDYFPDRSSIKLGMYRYTGLVRLPETPKADINQLINPQAVHFMIQFWDGRNQLGDFNKWTREGVIYWDLNPWEEDYGKIKIYSNSLELIDTGIKIFPDTNWHQFDLTIDLTTQKYISISIDNFQVDLSEFNLARVYHPEWGSDLMISITTESMATWPGEACVYPFTWTTQFKDLFFYSLN